MEKLILLVDDEQANIFALEVFLESNGCQIESGGSGRLLGMASRIGSMCEQKIIEWTGDKELAAKTEIVTSEHLNNIVIHGLQGECDSVVVVELSMDEAVRIRFFDRGVAWEPPTVSTQGGEVFAEDSKYAESGRGLKMIQSLASSFEHNRCDGINETVIEMARG